MRSVIRLYISFLYALVGFAVPFSITDEDNAKVIHFHREYSLPHKKLDYIHKGIIFIPHVSEEHDIKFDSSGKPLDLDGIYVIHLFHPSTAKRKSTVRIDPLEEIIHGSRYEVIPDSLNAYSKEIVIKRAVSRIGKYHRDHKYNVIFNNCGHFVHWAKEGESYIDSQFWDTADLKIGKLIGRKPAGKITRFARGLIERHMNRFHPDF